jgi:hypothetical protein
MENKKSKLYTKTGDKGTSSLYNGERVSKTSKYFKLLGDLDELNSFIGVAKSHWKEIINKSKKEIAEKIINQEIVPEQQFVVKSLKWELAIAMTAIHIEGTHWKLLIKTVFRESKRNPFRVGENQLVIYVNDI